MKILFFILTISVFSFAWNKEVNHYKKHNNENNKTIQQKNIQKELEKLKQSKINETIKKLEKEIIIKTLKKVLFR